MLTLGLSTLGAGCVDGEHVEIVSRSDPSLKRTIGVNLNGTETSYTSPDVARNFGVVSYNTPPQRHVFLLDGDVIAGTVPKTFVHLPPGGGASADDVSFDLTNTDPRKVLASVRVYDSGVCSVSPALFKYRTIATFLGPTVAAKLGEQDGIHNPHAIAQRLQPVFAAREIDGVPYGGASMDHVHLDLVWDADLIEGGPIGDSFECNGARVTMSLDGFFDAADGDIDVRVENFDVDVTQQPDWDGSFGSNRCRPHMRTRIEADLRDKFPENFEDSLRTMIASSAVYDSSDLGLSDLTCTTSDECVWNVGGNEFRGECDGERCSSVHVHIDRVNLRPDVLEVVWMTGADDPDGALAIDDLMDCDLSRYQSSSATLVESRFDLPPFVSGQVGLLP